MRRHSTETEHRDRGKPVPIGRGSAAERQGTAYRVERQRRDTGHTARDTDTAQGNADKDSPRQTRAGSTE